MQGSNHMHTWGYPIHGRKISKCRDHVMKGEVAGEESKDYISWTSVFIKYQVCREAIGGF